MPLKLFTSLLVGELFNHYGDNTSKTKSDATHYVSETGRHVIHPHVAVVPRVAPDQFGSSFYNQSKGDSNGSTGGNT